MAKIYQMWRVFHTDGGGMGFDQGTLGIFKEQATAVAINKRNPYTDFSQVWVVETGGYVYQLKDKKPIKPEVNRVEHEKKVKEIALAKLTDEEKSILGLLEDD
jgi:hypothetical protein